MNRIFIIILVVVAAGIGGMMAAAQGHPGGPHRAIAALSKKTFTVRTTHPRPAATSPSPKIPPAVIPSTGQSTASTAAASLAALTRQEGVAMPPGPIDVVANLANPTQQWAFATEAAKGASTGYSLWFGERTGRGPWTWIPSTLPGALSSKLPSAVYSALNWAWDLSQGQPGPTLLGTVSWNGITGRVGMPEGWTAQESHRQLTLTVWLPSQTGIYSGYYGVQTVWYPSTIAGGQSGLSMIVPGGQQTLSQLAQNPNF